MPPWVRSSRARYMQQCRPSLRRVQAWQPWACPVPWAARLTSALPLAPVYTAPRARHRSHHMRVIPVVAIPRCSNALATRFLPCSYYAADQAVLSLYALGRLSGTVVDVGYDKIGAQPAACSLGPSAPTARPCAAWRWAAYAADTASASVVCHRLHACGPTLLVTCCMVWHSWAGNYFGRSITWLP